MSAYYNEFDPHAAAWLRELIKAGHIPAGDVDERSIEDVRPDDLRGYHQHHFFAGIGGWAYALRLAGWPDDQRVWTGSCPCQPFSAAGKGTGFEDERHLWPAWQHLIAQCRPSVVFGEQVASAAVGPWLDLVQADLEGLGYAFGGVASPASGIGAPHIRDRTYWVADAGCARSTAGLSAPSRGHEGLAGVADHSRSEHARSSERSPTGWLAHSDGGYAGAEREQPSGQQRQQPEDGGVVWLADANRSSGEQGCAIDGGRDSGSDAESRARLGGNVVSHLGIAGALHGFWRDADWLLCRDGKWRPVEARPQPMADGLPNGLGYVRDSIVEEVEAELNSYATSRESSAAQELRNLCEALGQEAQRSRTPGGFSDLHSPPFLLAFVCQLAAQGWRLAQGLPLSGPQTPRHGVRMLWDNEAASRASRQRGLDGQPARERADALHLLSPVLARHAQAAWGDAFEAYAEIGFPIGKNMQARAARLRGYGNAIVPQQAAEFVKAFREACGVIEFAEAA